MKAAILLPLGAAALALGTSAERSGKPSGPETPASNGPSCHGALPAPADGAPAAPGVSAGLGDAGFRAERARPEAAAYFAQGVRLFHAFNAPEALRALRWAEQEDADCAMCFWAEAWARGPTINYPVDADQAGKARIAVERAAMLGRGLSPQAQGLIGAMQTRYPAAGGVDNAGYARAMDTLARRFPASDPIAVETASALLIASGQAWQNIAAQGPNPAVRRARALLDTVLDRSPDYVPAIHYDIHLSEWSGEPARALKGADRLEQLAPAAGHLVHMPSHLYFRLGRYQEAAVANAHASVADARFATDHRSPGGLRAFALHAHNVSFGLASALMSGDAAAALGFAKSAQATYGENGVGSGAYLAWARYGSPSAVLALPQPRTPKAQALWHYARGEAMARRGNGTGVAAEATAIAALQAADTLAGDTQVEVARLVLTGRAALLARRPADAVASLRRAADVRDKAEHNPDPPLWPLPPRRTLAAALLLGGDVAGAQAEARRSLKLDVADPLALHVLAEAQRRAGDRRAAATRAAADRSWRGDRELLRLWLI